MKKKLSLFIRRDGENPCSIFMPATLPAFGQAENSTIEDPVWPYTPGLNEPTCRFLSSPDSPQMRSVGKGSFTAAPGFAVTVGTWRSKYASSRTESFFFFIS